MTPRRARLVLVLVVLPWLALGVFVWEPMYSWVTTKRIYMESGSGEQRGWYLVSRWDDKRTPGPFVVWYVESGYKVTEETAPFARTIWNPNGTISTQVMADGTIKETPPWLWNSTDQTEPSMPAWMKDDEQWQRALDAQD